MTARSGGRKIAANAIGQAGEGARVDVGRHDGHRHRDRLCLRAVPGGHLGRPGRAAADRARTPAGLFAEPCRLLHDLDLLRLGGNCLRPWARFSADLYRPHSRRRVRASAAGAHRRAGARAEHHVGRRLRGGALRQGAECRGDGRAGRGDRRGALYRLAAQGDRRNHPDGDRLVRTGAAQSRPPVLAVLPRRRLAARRFCDGVRHAPHRSDRASGRADPGDRR